MVSALREEARRLGLDALGIANPAASEHLGFYGAWIGRGLHGEMGYLARPDAVARRGDLTRTMPEVRSVVVVAQEYAQPDPPGIPGDPSRGVVARYARGEDYHDVLKARLLDLLEWIRAQARGRGLSDDVRGFAYVDTGPILERELGRRAGLGWFGKNTMFIHPRRGSYFFLGILLLDLELPASEPFQPDRCGSCRACLDACPTGALLGRDEGGAPVMDARRCISYLTIELKGLIPPELRTGIGNRIFGCDICQEVCPWNRRFGEPATEPAYSASPGTDGPSLLALAEDLIRMDDAGFAERFSGSALKRARRRGLLRNVAVALGNWGSRQAIPALGRALDDPEPLVRGHAAWALGRILGRLGIPGDAGFEAAEALLYRKAVEEDPWVRDELEGAVGG
jgi:epoxyqueuosine reductase